MFDSQTNVCYNKGTKWKKGNTLKEKKMTLEELKEAKANLIIARRAAPGNAAEQARINKKLDKRYEIK